MALPKICTHKISSPKFSLRACREAKLYLFTKFRFSIKSNTKFYRVNGGQNGFSLIEILIAIALLAVLAGLGLALSFSSYRSYSFKSEQNLLVSLLQKARNESINNIDQAPHGLYINQTANSYTLFEGFDYNSRQQAQDITFSGNGSYKLDGLNEIVFDQLSGGTAEFGDITMDDHTRQVVDIEINSEGRINLR